MRIVAPALALSLCACTGDSLTTDDTDAMTMGDDTDMSPSCTTLTEGGWSADGSCFGHSMTSTLSLEADGCTFTFSGWSMSMATAPPDGGTVDGSDVTITGAEWSGCTGTTDGTSITGICGDGCGFDLASDG